MNSEERATYVRSQVTAAQIEMETMKAANEERKDQGHAQAYGEEAFTALIDKYGLGSNTVVTELQGR